MDEINQQTPGVFWDAPHFYLNDKIFIPKIFEPKSVGEPIPTGFNAVCISLDGSLKSALDWKNAIQAAQRYIEDEFLLFWNLELGLFSKLPHPLSNQTQFLSLGLSIEHFRDNVWKNFRKDTIGVCLYKGNADYHQTFIWDSQQEANLQEWLRDRFGKLETLFQETGISLNSFHDCSHSLIDQTYPGKQLLSLFCRDAAAGYLQILAARLPDGMEGFVSLDTGGIEDPVLKVNLLNKERYAPLHVMTDGLTMAPIDKTNIGICWPPLFMCRRSYYEGLNEALQQFMNQGIKYRTIPEETLITDWDGLDFLIVAAEGLSPQGKRKLQGFCAAGGTVVTLGQPIGLAQEKPWKDFCKY